MNKLLFLVVVLLSNIVQTISGFAGTMLAMPFSVRLIGFEDARYILNIISIVVSLYILITNRKLIKFKSIVEIVLLMGIGMFVGRLIISTMNLDILLKIYGIVIILVAVYQLSGKQINLNKISSIIILLVSGLIHGMFLSGGATLVIYAINKFNNKDEFRANLSLVWVILNSILWITMVNDGFKIKLSLTILSILVASLGIIIGKKFLDKINQDKFVILANILLIISGLSILI